MHLIFERSKGKFKSNCNILALAWMPYYNETQFRQALIDYHQKQLINLGNQHNRTQSESVQTTPQSHGRLHNQESFNLRPYAQQNTSQENRATRHANESGNRSSPQQERPNHVESESNPRRATTSHKRQEIVDFDTQLKHRLNSRLAALYQRYVYLSSSHEENSVFRGDQPPLDSLPSLDIDPSELERSYGCMPDFGWLAIGNVGKLIGITLTSTAAPPKVLIKQSIKTNLDGSNFSQSEDLMIFDDDEAEDYHQILKTGDNTGSNGEVPTENSCNTNSKQQLCNQSSEHRTNGRDQMNEHLRPDRDKMRTNYNLRGHLDEIILVKWNELYQKLATVDSKGNVIIWCKVNEKFTIQTPFYNRTKSVADFQWSNDGKTALICYIDSFILVGSSSAQRHWHSMLNLDGYQITCATWAPNDEQLLLGVAEGNLVVIDLPSSELTELAISQSVNIRSMCWSSSEMTLRDINNLSDVQSNEQSTSLDDTSSSNNRPRRNSTIVNQKNLYHSGNMLSLLFPNNPSCSDSMNGSPQNNGARNKTQKSGSNYLKGQNILALDLANNTIRLFDGGLDDPDPKTIFVNLESYTMNWSSDGMILAVAGFRIQTSTPSVGCLRYRYINIIKFYNKKGSLIHEHQLNYTKYPITTFTWAHNNSRIFIATGSRLHCAKVYREIPQLGLLSASCLQRNTKMPSKSDILEALLHNYLAYNLLKWQSHNCPINLSSESKRYAHLRSIIDASNKNFSALKNFSTTKYEVSESAPRPEVCFNTNVYRHLLPLKLQTKIDELFQPTLRQPFDEQWSLNDIIWQVPKDGRRHYCTLVCYTNDHDVNVAGYQYRTELMNGISSGEANHVSDQYKIFVLYVENQGSLIPILRARRVGFLKPEFVIFDPESNSSRTSQQRQRKVSDIPQSSSPLKKSKQKLLVDSINTQLLINTQNGHHETLMPLNIFNNRLVDNCSDLHSYSCTNNESRICNSPSIGRDSVASDAEHYYNFDCDSERQQSYHSKLLYGRSSHQEPLPLGALSTSPYLSPLVASTSEAANSSSTGPLHGIKILKGVTNSVLPSVYGASSRRDIITAKQPINNLNEANELIRIKSNIWGTKFCLLNVGNRMIKQRYIIGSVIYKTSILHLQPRQIFLNLQDMSNYCCLCSKHHHIRTGASKRHQSSSYQHKNPSNPENRSVNLLDTPNIFSPVLTPSRNHRNIIHFRSSSVPREPRADANNKVLMQVGDNIRIAPKLDRNQRYRLVDCSIVDEQVASTSHDLATHRSNEARRDRGSSSVRASMTRSVFSETSVHQENLQDQVKVRNNAVLRSRSRQSEGRHRYRDDICVSRKDEVLRMSLGDDNQISIDMPALEPELSATDDPINDNKNLDEFLASNKTLKSIQSITKMIVDLSSKADSNSESEGNQHLNLTRPKKFSGESESTSSASPTKPVNSESLSTFYNPPQAPVHRPKKVSNVSRSHQLKNQSFGPVSSIDSNGRRYIPPSRPSRNRERYSEFHSQTQSATSTPLRGLNAGSYNPGDKNHNRRVHRSSQSYREKVSRGENARKDSAPSANLPAPPPSVSIRRRLSSSAKRFLDGSLRSLYSSGSGYSLGSDLDQDQEDNQPLVGGPASKSSFNRFTSRRSGSHCSRDRLNEFRAVSQPSTPLARRRPFFMVPQELMQSRGSRPKPNGNLAHDPRPIDYPPQILNGFRHVNNRSGSRRARHKSQSFMNLDESNQEYRNERFKSSSSILSNDLPHDSPSEDDIDFSSDDDDDDNSTSQDSGFETNGVYKREGKFRRKFNSVKDLSRRLDRRMSNLKDEFLGNKEGDKGDMEPKGSRKGSRSRVNYKRRRPVCASSKCDCAREFNLSNRPPVWNELSQVYQLDFGGRVTQESAKNLQIDHDGSLVLQFGRIDRCTYTLDYQYPFNAVQAMSVALASLTQRLK